MSIKVGDSVKVKTNHHFRGGQSGVVFAYDESAEFCHWVIVFDNPGYGYTIEGKEGFVVRLDEASLEAL